MTMRELTEEVAQLLADIPEIAGDGGPFDLATRTAYLTAAYRASTAHWRRIAEAASAIAARFEGQRNRLLGERRPRAVAR